MNITYNGNFIPVFNLLGIRREHRDFDNAIYRDIEEFIAKSEAYGYHGILLPESNEGLLNPWFFADMVLHQVKKLHPFIAVNPVYAHPFYTAKYIANISLFSGKPLYLNYITGTGLFDAGSLGDTETHDAKYLRLQEYLQIVNRLLGEDEVTYEGKFYQIKNLSLPQRLEAPLFPRNFIAGNSEAALDVINNTGATRLAMAMPLDDLKALNLRKTYQLGFHFGILSRADAEAATAALSAYCPEDQQKKSLQQLTTRKSAVIWKKELLEKSKNMAAGTYNLTPFATGYSDVPYLVGSYKEVAKTIHEFLQYGLDLMVLEIPLTGADEFYHIGQVFAHLSDLQEQIPVDMK